VKSKPPAPPLSIANVTQGTASGSGDRQTAVKARPAAPPPSIRNLKTKQETAPPRINLKTKQETAPPSRNVKPKQEIALPIFIDQQPHHAAAPPSKQIKTKLETASVSGDPSKGEMEVDAESWNKMTLKEIQHRLAIRGFRKGYKPDGKRMIKEDYLKELERMMQ